MRPRQLDFQGFGVVSALIVVGVLIVMTLTGIDIYRQTHKTKGAPMVATSQKAADPYTGWETAILKYEKASFEYPSSWTLKNSSWVQSDTPGIPAPWGDTATITSPTGISVVIDTGNEDFNNPAVNATVQMFQPIRTLGGNYSLAFYKPCTQPLPSG